MRSGTELSQFLKILLPSLTCIWIIRLFKVIFFLKSLSVLFLKTQVLCWLSWEACACKLPLRRPQMMSAATVSSGMTQ